MDLSLTDEQDELVASFAQLFTKSASSERVREVEAAGGFDEALWATLTETGGVTMAIPEGRGGWGASLVDLALVAEQLGRTVAPAPLVEAQVAARLLASFDSPAATDALAGVIEQGHVATVALHRPVDGAARLVPAGAVADHVIVRDGATLRLVSVGDDDRTIVRNLADAPLADLALGDRGDVLAEADVATEAFELALDEWLALTASSLVGVSARAVEIAAEYATERVAFGAPIGSFQGVSHPLADDATAVDGARLLARKAAWALDGQHPRARELAAMAFAFASEAAATSTYDALHTHGGYGYMLEYDVQLHYRRARGWARVWGDVEAAHRRVADARYGASGGER